MKSLVIALPQPLSEVQDKSELRLIQRLGAFFRRCGLPLFLTVLLTAGLIVGAVNASSGNFSLSDADRFFISLPDGEVRTPAAVFADSFCVSFLFTAAICFFAFTPAGLPAVPAVIFFRGYELGIMAGYMSVSSGFTGIAYVIGTVLAGAFLSSLAIVYVSQYSLACSASMLLAIFGHFAMGRHDLRLQYRELVMNAAYTLIIAAFASLTDTVLWFLIGRSFQF